MTDPTPGSLEQASTRLLKYLPMMMIGHLLITIPTFVISIALAYATFVQADATRKIQRSETWPFVSYGTGNATTDGKPEITLSLTNNGVGPAKLVAMEFIYRGRHMPNPREYLRQCCAGESKFTFMSEPVTGVLRPGQQRNFIRLGRTDSNAELWEKLNTERWKVVVRSCYCSIFEDCWVTDSTKANPESVKSCPTNWKSFDERPFAGTTGESQAGF
jgi:hypothetical protein